MNELENSLAEVRKAYRLLYDYQKKVLDLVKFIGSEFGRSYSGGHPQFSNASPRNGKGNLSLWAWDWLNMYYYEFTFHNPNENNFFSIILLSDSGYFDMGKQNTNEERTHIKKFNNAEFSKTKLAFLYGSNGWFYEGFLKDGCWVNPENSYVYESEDNSGKMLFKRYNLEEFSNQENTIKVLRDYSNFCKKNGVEFNLNRDRDCFKDSKKKLN